MLAFVIGQKTFSNDIMVYKCKLFLGMAQRKIKLEDCRIAEQGGIYAHGATLKAAMSDLQFKLAKCRGSEQYRGTLLDKPIPFDDAVSMYRIITGACQLGTEQFIKTLGDKIKDQYSPKEVLEITHGQYGHSAFTLFFEQWCEWRDSPSVPLMETVEVSEVIEGGVPMNSETSLVREDDCGVLHCALCGSEVECDEFGDFPDICPGCKLELDWVAYAVEAVTAGSGRGYCKCHIP